MHRVRRRSLCGPCALCSAVIVAPGIPACEEKFLLRKPCYDFVWSGYGSLEIEKIVRGIMRNNPGRPISSDRVMSFGTPEEVDTWLNENPMRCPGALHFVERNSTVISYGIQTNSSSEFKEREEDSPDMIPCLQIAAEREIARSLLGDPNFSWTVGLKEFAHPLEDDNSMDSGELDVFVAAAMFGFIFQIGSVVAERELKLRQAMSMMGLYDSVYWLSWLTWEAMLVVDTSLLTVLSGMMLRFPFFLRNSFAILFLTFFLFQLSMVGFAYMLSNFFRKSSSADTVAFCIFLLSTCLQYADLYKGSKIQKILVSLFPPFPFIQAMKSLSGAMETPGSQGISWSERGRREDGTISIEDAFIALIFTFCWWSIVAIYLDNVMPDSNGVRKPVYYFIMPSYWTGRADIKIERGSSLSSLDNDTPVDEDVLAEETTVKGQVSENKIDTDIAVQVRGLAKTYPGTVDIGCFKLRKSAAYHAVKGLWVNFPKNQLFCLLGANGAGKTTTISCLTGLLPATGGDALIYGQSVRNPVGMTNIRKMIGVCPQFDTLWDALSAREHLHLFASIKGLHPSAIEEEVAKSLTQVRLGTAAEVRSGSYSGGMKRRLSVAIALLGDPKLVFLDEPTTGMDPISRRQVWDIIEEAKKGRAIVLTTHSMEEADILSDRIAIMAYGRLRCIGNSLRLKSKFGGGYVATVSLPGGDVETSADQAKPVKQFFKDRLGVDPKEENHRFLTFIISREKEAVLADFFTELQDQQLDLGISDIQIGITTLEEVFLKIAKKAEFESHADAIDLVDLSLSSKVILVPRGARFVGIPGTESSDNPMGVMVEVFWHEDDTGELSISGHSDETPIPQTVQFTAKTVTAATYSGSKPLGFAINPDQIERSE